jgi:hypothetical protein
VAVVRQHPVAAADPLPPLDPALADLERRRASILGKRLREQLQRSMQGAIGVVDAVDLELIDRGLLGYAVKPSGLHAFPMFVVTAQGVRWLSWLSAQRREARRPHESLIEGLASHLRAAGRLVWANIEFPAVVGGRAGAAAHDSSAPCRPDVYSILPSLSEERCAPIVHEIKVSRSDLMADLAQPDKRERYFRVASRVVYVMPESIAAPDDVPRECGLLLARSAGGFVEVRRGVKRKTRMQPADWLNLIVKQQDLASGLSTPPI